TRDSSGSGVSSAAPMPVQSAGPLLELGETVTLTGTIAGAAVWSGEQRQLHLGLHVEEGDPLQPTTQYYPLTGSAETLEALSENYRLHVQITGTVVEMDSQASNQQGSLVTEFSRPWPGEQIETFLGYIEWVELGGQEVALFTDEESGQEYILPNAWGFLPNPEQKVWMEGVVHPTHQIEGRPLFQPFGRRSGTDIDNATSASDFVPETTLPETHNNARQNAPGLQGTLIIDRVVLGYSTSLHASAEGSPTETLLTPVWIFSGRTAGGSQTFQIQVDATVGD